MDTYMTYKDTPIHFTTTGPLTRLPSVNPKASNGATYRMGVWATCTASPPGVADSMMLDAGVVPRWSVTVDTFRFRFEKRVFPIDIY